MIMTDLLCMEKLGKYKNGDEVPLYLKRENFDIIRSRIDRIKLITADAQGWLVSTPIIQKVCIIMKHHIFHMVVRWKLLYLHWKINLKLIPPEGEILLMIKWKRSTI